jgi:TRAP-type C4-dicarboxylate transport system permease small subunit
MLRRYGALTRHVERIAVVVCVVLFLIVVMMNAFEAVSRSLFAASSIYTVEGSVMLISLVYFLGYLVLMYRDEDISLDYFYVRFPGWLQRLVDLFVAAGTVMFFIVLTWTSFSFAMRVSALPDPVMPFSESIGVLPVLIGSLGCLWVAVYRLVRVVHTWTAAEACD